MAHPVIAPRHWATDGRRRKRRRRNREGKRLHNQSVEGVRRKSCGSSSSSSSTAMYLLVYMMARRGVIRPRSANPARGGRRGERTMRLITMRSRRMANT